MMAVAAAMYVGIVSALTSSHLPKTHAAAPIGAPLPLVELPLGVEVPAYRSHTHEFTAERLANSPAAFLLRGFLTNDECSALMSAAEESGTFHSAETSGGTSARQKCDIALLGMDCPVVATLTRDAARLLLEPEARMAPGSGCEDVHVLKYGAGGQFLPHYDAVSLPRVLTILYYLNGVGATWFPIADDGSAERIVTTNRADVAAHVATLDPVVDGVPVQRVEL